MKKSKLLLIASLAILSLGACKKDKDPDPTQDQTAMFPDKTVDVYLAGYEPNENGVSVAKYWKNGVPVALTNGTFNAKAYAVFISGADIYVCGTEENQDGKTVAKYWKNGNEVILSNGTQNATAFSIAVVNNAIYVSGNEFNASNKEIARCWIDGVATALPDGAFGTEITVAGNDIYIGGRQGSNNIEMKVRCWKNGQLYPMNDTTRSHASSGKAIGNDIYLAGLESTIYGSYRAKCWKNGNPVTLDFTDLATPGSSYTSGIEVEASDVFVSGSRYVYNAADSSYYSQACYWKNGAYISLADNANTGAICKFNNYLYITGTYTRGKGVVWVDGKVSFTANDGTVFLDIKVTPK